MTAGDVYTVVGDASGTSGTSGDGRPGTSSYLNQPVGVVVSSTGDLYITDTGDTALSNESAMLASGPGPVPAGATGSKSVQLSSVAEVGAALLALSPESASVTTTTTYDADDEPTLVTDPDGNATLTCYDGDGNVAETVPAVGVAANSLSPS